MSEQPIHYLHQQYTDKIRNYWYFICQEWDPKVDYTLYTIRDKWAIDKNLELVDYYSSIKVYPRDIDWIIDKLWRYGIYNIKFSGIRPDAIPEDPKELMIFLEKNNSVVTKCYHCQKTDHRYNDCEERFKKLLEMTDDEYQTFIKKFKEKFPDIEIFRNINLYTRIYNYSKLDTKRFIKDLEYIERSDKINFISFILDFYNTKNIITHFDDNITLEQLASKINELEVNIHTLKTRLEYNKK